MQNTDDAVAAVSSVSVFPEILNDGTLNVTVKMKYLNRIKYEVTTMSGSVFNFKRIFLLTTFLLGLSYINSYSQEMAVPVNLQAALFKKIFSFDKTLQSKGIQVAVLSSDGAGDAVVSAFKDAGLNAVSVKGSSVPAGATVVYVMPGVSSPKQQTSQKGVLSISGVTANAESGNVAVGIGVEGGKPKIIVNMGQLKAEKHELSADLLKIAKVIQ